jgi:Asp-tRNA(Asn)/Glu-tRNA(Gln) amidotransferase A subunit family amidase
MTYPFNMLSQLPVMSVPSGFALTGVPTGIQIVGRSYDDLSVFRIARTLELAASWGTRVPRL